MSASVLPPTDASSLRAPSSVAELVHLVQHAAAHDTPLRLVGSGTWLDAGGPFAQASHVSLRALQTVIDYEPGDLVITVGAGMSLAELAEVTRAHGQMLAAAPYGHDASTVGACIATAAPAPLALGDLTMRDLVLGVSVVSGTGEVVRGGGRVVKNVAGFDLVRLQTGAWGTLGALTEVTLRLHAIPPVDDIHVGEPAQPIAELLPRLVANRAPLPMQLRLTPHAPPQLWARISGNAARAAALHARLVALGVRDLTRAADLRPLRETAEDTFVLRARAPLSDAVPLVDVAQRSFPDATLSYDPARGTLRIVGRVDRTDPGAAGATLDPSVTPTAKLHASIEAFRTRCAAGRLSRLVALVIERGPREARERTALDAGLKQALDPRDILNRVLLR